jgi:hypothetical protein
MPSKQPSRIPPWRRKAILAIAVVCVAAAAILMAARQPFPAEDQPRVETSIVAAHTEAPVVAKPAPRVRATQTDTRKPAASGARTVTTAAAKPAATGTSATPIAGAAASIGSTAELATRPAGESPARAPRTEAAAQGEVATISGCLEFDDDTFRLTDTEGENAPKARSWRSGFIRRSSARVDVVDASNRLGLPTHVGHRVSITGMLVEREMQARSVKMVADTCDD